MQQLVESFVFLINISRCVIASIFVDFNFLFLLCSQLILGFSFFDLLFPLILPSLFPLALTLELEHVFELFLRVLIETLVIFETGVKVTNQVD